MIPLVCSRAKPPATFRSNGNDHPVRKMKCRTPIITGLLLFSLLAVDSTAGDTRINAIRKPVFAGKWYPGDPTRLEHLLARFTNAAKAQPVRIPRNKKLKALIMPHAGIVFSGPTAAYAVHVLKKDQFNKIILMGPDHRVGFQNGTISDVHAYQTPLGRVHLHVDGRRLRARSTRFHAVPASDATEHSLEMVLLFLQYYAGSFQLVPIVLGHGEIAGIVEDLDSLLDKDTLLAVSSDLSHFLDAASAEKKDLETIDMIRALQADQILTSDNRACGKAPIAVLLKLAQRRRWQPFLLHYANSGLISGDHRSVVGYTTIAFYGD